MVTLLTKVSSAPVYLGDSVWMDSRPGANGRSVCVLRVQTRLLVSLPWAPAVEST